MQQVRANMQNMQQKILDGLHRARAGAAGKSTILADDRPVAKKVAGASAQGSELGSQRLKR